MYIHTRHFLGFPNCFEPDIEHSLPTSSCHQEFFCRTGQRVNTSHPWVLKRRSAMNMAPFFSGCTENMIEHDERI